MMSLLLDVATTDACVICRLTKLMCKLMIFALNACVCLLQDLCEAVRGPCSLVEEGVGWPGYMSCLSAHDIHKQSPIAG